MGAVHLLQHWPFKSKTIIHMLNIERVTAIYTCRLKYIHKCELHYNIDHILIVFFPPLLFVCPKGSL